MQSQATYGKEAAEIIVRGYLSPWVEWRDDGLFIKKGMFENDPSESVFHWLPACDMDWHGAPDPLTAPSLPFPFTASQLAAFMLNGIGTQVASAYGTWQDGPDEEMLEAMGVRARMPREALRAAFSLYRETEQVVGKLAPEILDEWLPIHPRILRAQGNDLALQAEMKFSAWCKRMVHQLLQPQTDPVEIDSTPSSLTPTLAKSAPDWMLRKSKRPQGYSEALYDKLKKAHDAGLPRPTPLDLLDAFFREPHIDVTVVENEGLKYTAGKGTKIASLDAIRKAIGRMTERPAR